MEKIPLRERKIMMWGMMNACRESVGRGALSNTEIAEVLRRMDMLDCLFPNGYVKLWVKVKKTARVEMEGLLSIQEGLGIW